MFAYTALAVLAALAYGVSAAPEPLEPSSTSVFNIGGNCTILWTPDATGVWKIMNIELMTGDNFNQVHLKTVATVDGTDPNNHSFAYTCLAVTPTSPIYFYKFTSPASSDVLFTTRFTIADASGNSTAATETQTATNGDIIHWGTGALVDPSQGDQPPAAGTGSSNSTAPVTSGTASSTGRGGSTSTRISSGTGTSTATTTSRPNGASQTLPLASLALGAFGALAGILFL